MQIRDKHPGSARLQVVFYRIIKDFKQNFDLEQHAPDNQQLNKLTTG
jgi:hypothetical protein